MNVNYKQLIENMTVCEQTKGMSVLQHGQMVNDYYRDLLSHLRKQTPLKYKWRIPEWIFTYKNFIFSKLHDDATMGRYQVHHDCGKPYCKTIDEQGKQHFPDHAEVSYQIWTKLFPEDEIVASLIKYDMEIHCLKSEQLDEFSKNPLAVSLMITGLCEVHANASMFGGIESTSFKIKWKQIDKRGRQIIEKMIV